ncbi:hypothetical protein ABPG74_007521 [Tetrahymena malaccensis]
MSIVLVIKQLMYIDVEIRIPIQNYISVGSLTINQTIKYSLSQKSFLLVVYLINLYFSKQISFKQYFTLSLALLSIVFQAGRLFYYLDIIHINNPFKLEIDNVYDLKRYMNLYQVQSQSNKKSFFQNLKVIQIFIRQEHFLDQKDFIQCLFCSFGNLEIQSQSYQRKYINNSIHFQSVKIPNTISANTFKEGLCNQKILPSIAQLEIPAKKITDFEHIIRFLYKNNILLKIENLDLTFFIDKKMNMIRNYNHYVRTVQRAIMLFVAFTKQISSEQTFNPKIIFYDIFE